MTDAELAAARLKRLRETILRGEEQPAATIAAELARMFRPAENRVPS
jgi:hypothetical protein